MQAFFEVDWVYCKIRKTIPHDFLMQQDLRILMAQINPTVGAISKNTQKIIECIQTHQKTHDLIVFPELALTGYPPEDLLLRNEFYDHIEKSLEQIRECIEDCYIIVGHPSVDKEHRYNSASVFNQKKRLRHYHKQNLPNYGIFDEVRYFTHGLGPNCLFSVKDTQIGLCICEDMWQKGPVERLVASDCELLICINASPFEAEKLDRRKNLAASYAKQGPAIIYLNQVGGQDELVFDGQSFAMNSNGEIAGLAPAFEESFLTLSYQNKSLFGDKSDLLSKNALIYKALVCGLRDYVNKNGFPGALVGLSGGIDSALTLAIAVDALGADNVHAVMMPSRYTAKMSHEDALAQINALGVKHSLLPIEPSFKVVLDTLQPEFKNCHKDVTEENIQARIRGLFLMALSNKTGKMVVATSNKSESAVGYATLYGDMVGGLSILKDILKTKVYALAKYRNQISQVIPERVITRAPSAELAENQTDQDSLPDYSILDKIIVLYMDKGLCASEIIENGFEAGIVHQVIKLISRNEYKRYQSAPGLKISHCAFGKDWRYPLTSGFLSS